jgi:HSP20 family protein
VDRPTRRALFGDTLSDELGDSAWRPAVDVFETEKAVVVQVELAGVARDDLRITVDAGVLRIRGVRGPGRDDEVQRLHQVEIERGPFERAVRIGIPFEREGVRASLDEGFLRVTLPKRLPQNRRIPVEGAPPADDA